jgi:hypothetical protein
VIPENVTFFDFVVKYSTFFFDGMGGVNSANIDKCFEWETLEEEEKDIFVKKLIVYLRTYLTQRNRKMDRETTTKE